MSLKIVKCRSCLATVSSPMRYVGEEEAFYQKDVTKSYVGYEDKEGEIFDDIIKDDVIYSSLVENYPVASMLRLHINKLDNSYLDRYVGTKNFIHRNVVNCDIIGSGFGCCDDDYLKVVCICGEVLGWGGRDCWQDKTVSLLNSKVRVVGEYDILMRDSDFEYFSALLNKAT